MFNRLSKTVIISGGGTCGHIIPALTVAEILLGKGYRVLFVTDTKFDNYAQHFQSIISSPSFNIVRVKSNYTPSMISRLLSIFKLLSNIVKISRIILKYNVSVVAGFGGFVSISSVIAGFLTFRKCVIHEQNACLGFANRVSAIFSSVILLGFPDTYGIPRIGKGKYIFVGNPVSQALKKMHYKNNIDAINYEAFFKIHDKISIVIVGGSQGATILGDEVAHALCDLPMNVKKKLTIHHQCRASDVDKILSIYNDKELYADVRSFFADLPSVLSGAHIFIGRSGAGAISDITTLGVPSILVPFAKAANNHQFKNAQYLYKNGACVLIDETDFSCKKLTGMLTVLLKDERGLFEMSENAKKLCVINASSKIALIVDRLRDAKSVDDFAELSAVDASRLINDVGIG